MADSSPRIAIAVAVIALVGTLGAALIANWDKIFEPSPRPAPRVESSQPARNEPRPLEEPAPRTTPTEPRPSAEAVPSIVGVWRDSNYPGNGSRITQDGNRFRFTRWGVLPNGTQFESSGSGTITGRRFTSSYTARYQNNATSAGDCSGTVSPDGTRMDFSCNDSLLGTFPVIAVRQ